MKNETVNSYAETGFYNQMFIAGPLTLDCYRNRAHIVPNIEILFDQDEFHTLHMLAAREDMPFTLEQIYEAIWEPHDGSDRLDEAREGVENVMERVNAAGNGFVWIDSHPVSGFTFRTKWAHNRERWIREGYPNDCSSRLLENSAAVS